MIRWFQIQPDTSVAPQHRAPRAPPAADAAVAQHAGRGGRGGVLLGAAAHEPACVGRGVASRRWRRSPPVRGAGSGFRCRPRPATSGPRPGRRGGEILSCMRPRCTSRRARRRRARCRARPTTSPRSCRSARFPARADGVARRQRRVEPPPVPRVTRDVGRVRPARRPRSGGWCRPRHPPWAAARRSPESVPGVSGRSY